MTSIYDATTTITRALNDHDRQATGVCNTGRNVRLANMIARALDAAGHLMPDLPEPDYDSGGWKTDGLFATPASTDGSVILEWFDREDNGHGTTERHLRLTPDQVQAIIAAHYHREDQE